MRGRRYGYGLGRKNPTKTYVIKRSCTHGDFTQSRIYARRIARVRRATSTSLDPGRSSARGKFRESCSLRCRSTINAGGLCFSLSLSVCLFSRHLRATLDYRLQREGKTFDEKVHEARRSARCIYCFAIVRENMWAFAI